MNLFESFSTVLLESCSRLGNHLSCIRPFNESNYMTTKLRLLRKFKNGSHSQIGQSWNLYEEQLSKCIPHFIKHFAIGLFDNPETEILLQWGLHKWDEETFIDRIVILINGDVRQTFIKDGSQLPSQFLIEKRKVCTPYKICLHIQSGHKERFLPDIHYKTLGEKCVNAKT